MNIPRIVLTQSSHVAAWGTPAGRFYLITNESTRKEVGEEFLASIIASRETILQVRESCSMNDAAEKYHNPHSPGFKQLLRRMGQGGEQPIYHGPELLLYLHGHDRLATFLLAIKDGQHQLHLLKNRHKTDSFSRFPATRFGVKKLSNRQYAFNLPTLKPTELNWTNRLSVDPERRVFEAASNKLETYPLPLPIRTAVAQFNRAVNQLGRVGFKFDRRKLENMIQQANDGDYGIEEFDSMSQSDFH